MIINDEGRKINYAYGLGGMELTMDKVSEVTGLTIHYYVLLDFSGFRQLIDDVNGRTVASASSLKLKGKGKANLAVIELLALNFRVPKTQIELISGHRDKHKIFEIFEA